MRDGILHNLVRKQQRRTEAQKHSPRSLSPPAAHDLPVSISGEPTENSILDYLVPYPRKIILKAPKVHFPENVDGTGDVGIHPPTPPGLETTDSIPLSPSSSRNPIAKLTAPYSATLPAPPPPPPTDSPQAPTLFNREIAADEYLNNAAYTLYTKFIDQLSVFVDQQDAVIRLRLAVQEKRQDLRRLRANVSQCDIALIDYLRKCILDITPTDLAKVNELLLAAEAARDLVGPKELEYEPMEVGLGAEEHKLKDQYAIIEGRFEHFFKLNATSTTKQSIPSKIEYEASTAPSGSGGGKEWSGLEPRDTSLFHGRFIGDQINIGQTPKPAESRTADIITSPEITKNHIKKSNVPERYSDSADDSTKYRSVATIGDKSFDGLATDLLGVACTEDSVLTHLQKVNHRNRRLSQSLKGVSYDSLFETFVQPEVLPPDLPLDPGLQEGDSLLLLDQNTEIRSVLSDYLISFESTRDRVNRWILHQLRISPREIYALRRQVIECTPGVPHWAILALSEWPNDMLGPDQSRHQGSLEGCSDDPVMAPNPFLDADPLAHMPTQGRL